MFISTQYVLSNRNIFGGNTVSASSELSRGNWGGVVVVVRRNQETSNNKPKASTTKAISITVTDSYKGRFNFKQIKILQQKCKLS